jgi:hypothetical protein
VDHEILKWNFLAVDLIDCNLNAQGCSAGWQAFLRSFHYSFWQNVCSFQGINVHDPEVAGAISVEMSKMKLEASKSCDFK